jgi:hypothetical protein
MSNLVHNEQVKLVATFYNNSAVAAAFGAVIAPALAISIAHESSVPGFVVLALGLPMAYSFHLWAVRELRKLKE